MRTAVLIVAAGRGTRAMSAATAAPGLPKQYAPLLGRTVLERTLAAFERHPMVTDSLVVIHRDDSDLYSATIEDRDGGAENRCHRHKPATGGATRQDSVRLGLMALADAVRGAPTRVLIHDAARPFVSPAVIDRVISHIEPGRGVIAALPVADTLKRAATRAAGAGSAQSAPVIGQTVDRDGLWQAQTPQGFMLDDILALHDKAAGTSLTVTDDAALAEAAGYPVALVLGDAANRKLTTAEDMIMAEAWMRAAKLAATPAEDGAVETYETRTGSGFDVHRFAAGDHVWLGGVRIAHTARLDGHSDADVVLHALTDALLGTIGDGDIGQHFPPSDPQWKGARSVRFLEDAKRRIDARGGRIINVDVTVLAEAPKIGPHRPAMQAVIGAALGLAADRIGIKATTMEGLGFIGRSEGICAMASATVSLPSTSSAAGNGHDRGNQAGQA